MPNNRSTTDHKTNNGQSYEETLDRPISPLRPGDPTGEQQSSVSVVIGEKLVTIIGTSHGRTITQITPGG